MDRFDGSPVAGFLAPAFGPLLAGELIDLASGLEDAGFASEVVVVGSDEAQGAVEVLTVVPGDELGRRVRARKLLARDPQPAVGAGASRGSLALAFGMGAIAALLAGACVAPVVIQVVLFSSDLYAQGTGIALGLPFVLGIGMAIPWPIAGAGLTRLPKPGAWMVRVKQLLGAVILATGAQELADAMVRVLTDDALRARLTEGALARAPRLTWPQSAFGTLQVVAEEVDRRQLLQALRSAGVRGAQGYLLGEPRPLEDVLAALT